MTRVVGLIGDPGGVPVVGKGRREVGLTDGGGLGPVSFLSRSLSRWTMGLTVDRLSLLWAGSIVLRPKRDIGSVRVRVDMWPRDPDPTT